MVGSRKITTIKLFDGKAIAQNESETSVAIDLREIVDLYKFSFHAIVEGAGQLDISVLTCSEKDGTYIADSTLIADDQSAGSIFASFDPVLTPFMKIKATENNYGAITSLDLWLNIA